MRLWTGLLSWINLASGIASRERRGGCSWGFEPAHSCVPCADSHGYHWRARWELSEYAPTVWVVHTPKSLTSLSHSLMEGGVAYMGGGGVVWVAAGCFVCSCVSGYPACPALVLPGHVAHRLFLLFTFLMRGAGLWDMWLTAASSLMGPLPLPCTPRVQQVFGFLAEKSFEGD